MAATCRADGREVLVRLAGPVGGRFAVQVLDGQKPFRMEVNSSDVEAVAQYLETGSRMVS